MRINRFDRSTVRALALEHFGSDRMVDEYVTAYRHVLDHPKVRTPKR
jgi:hypothetical protein